jgi:hypothetical protein
MDQLLTETKNYMNLVTNKLESINNSYNLGIVKLLDSNKNYTKGKLNLGTLTPNNIVIYGKPVFDETLKNAFDLVLKSIDDGSNVIIDKLKKIYNTEQTPIPLIKTNLKNYIQDLQSTFSNGITTTMQELVTGQENYVQVIRKLNVVVDKLDGKILDTGKPRMYGLSGITSGNTDSYKQLVSDYAKLIEVLMNTGTGFNSLLETIGKDIAFGFNIANGAAPNQTNYKDGNFVLATNPEIIDTKVNKLFFMIMSRIITDKNKKKQFIDAIIKGDELKKWKTPVNLSNKFEKIVNDLDSDYSKELKAEEKIFTNLRKDKLFKDLIDGLETKMYKPKVNPRKFEYTTVGDLTAQESKILNLYNGQNGSEADKTNFDNRITFN